MSSESTVRVRAAVRAACSDLEPGQRALVACSGGPDSLALAAAAAWVAEREGWLAGAVVVDHGLQHDSARVAGWAAGVCSRLGLDPVTVRTVRVDGPGGPEAAARDARYRALIEAADESGAVAVLLGHTLEDQAETVLLRLARGSGARSLAGMAPQTGRWRRPLLGLRRADVRASAREVLDGHGERAWLDPHNEDPQFARVRVRRLLDDLQSAVGAGAVLGLARSASLLRDDADALEAWAERASDELVRSSSGDRSADARALLALPRAVRTRVIRGMCLAAGCPAEDLGVEHIAEVDRLVSAWSGQGPTSLPGRVTASRSYGRLVISPRPVQE